MSFSLKGRARRGTVALFRTTNEALKTMQQLNNPLNVQLAYRVFAIRGDAIRAKREKMAMSQQTVAKRCNWSRTYQAKLEATEINYLVETSAQMLVEALGHTWVYK